MGWLKQAGTVLLLGSVSIGLGLSGLPASAAPLMSASLQWKTQLAGGWVEDSSPTLADIDDDGKDEIIIGTTKKGGTSPVLAVVEDNGSVKWSRTLDDPMSSAPTVTNITYPADNIPEIIVSTGGDSSQTRGSIIAYDRNGNRLWKYDTNDAQGTGTANGNWASPVVGDVDGDGDVEIVVGSWDRNIYMLDHNGNYVWHYHVADSIWSTAVLADLDKDDDLEIIVGTDITGGGILPDGYAPTDGGFMLILDKDGDKLARLQMNETIFSSPAVGDVDGDGQLEIFVGTGMHYFGLGNYTQPYVYGFSVDTSGAEWQLNDLPGWPQPVAYAGMSSPALADLDGDGDPEIVIGTGYIGLGPENACSSSASDPDCHGALYAWHHNGSLVSGFPMWPTENNGKNAFIRSSPTVADVDGDGDLEILFSMGWEVIIVGKNGNQEAALHTDYSVFASPAIGDLDNDGRTNVIIGGASLFDPAHGYVYNFEFDANSYNAASKFWPTFHRDAQNSGYYPNPPRLSVVPTSLYLLHQYGDASNGQRHLQIRNTGEGSFPWTASSESVSITVNPLSGMAPDTSSVQAKVIVTTTGYTTGTYSLGSIVITGTLAGVPVEGSPVEIPVTLYVGRLHPAYVPLIWQNHSP